MRAGGGVPAVEWGVRAGGGVRGDCGTPASRACGTAAGGTAFLSPAPLPGCLQPPERGNWVNRLSKKAVTFSVAKELVQGAPPRFSVGGRAWPGQVVSVFNCSVSTTVSSHPSLLFLMVFAGVFQ